MVMKFGDGNLASLFSLRGCLGLEPASHGQMGQEMGAVNGPPNCTNFPRDPIDLCSAYPGAEERRGPWRGRPGGRKRTGKEATKVKTRLIPSVQLRLDLARS